MILLWGTYPQVYMSTGKSLEGNLNMKHSYNRVVGELF